MDQLTAYRILRLEPGCSPEEIKAAYASLSKEFHPEEQPEEFQKIHEAYRLLVKMNRSRRNPGAERGSRPPFETHDPGEPGESRTEREDFDEILRRAEERINAEQRVRNLEDYENLRQAEEENAEQRVRNLEDYENLQQAEEENAEGGGQYKFDDVLRRAQENTAEEEAPEKYDFESTLRQNELDERERIHKLCQKALIEMELLLSPQYRNNIKIYREFFEKSEYQEILRNTEFLAGLCRMLEGSALKKKIYSYIIDVYRLRGADPGCLKPEISDLYRVLERKGGVKKKKNGWAFVIPVAFLAAVRSGLKMGTRAARITHNSGAFIVACILVAILCFFIWLYRKLTEKHSSIFAQFIIALCLALSQFIMMGVEAYAPLIGVVGSDTVGFLLFALGCIWLLVLLIVSVVQKIKKLRSFRDK